MGDRERRRDILAAVVVVVFAAPPETESEPAADSRAGGVMMLFLADRWTPRVRIDVSDKSIIIPSAFFPSLAPLLAESMPFSPAFSPPPPLPEP